MFKVCACFISLFLSFAALADSAFIPFPEPSPTYVNPPTENKGTFPLTLGTFTKVNGAWSASREIQIEGTLNTYTQELKMTRSLEAVFNQLQEYFSENDATLLFDCDGMACGSSNAWANERFATKQLYGLDTTQHYQVWQLADGGVYTSIYLVQRGNRRVYLHTELLFPNKKGLYIPPSPSVIAQKFSKNGWIEMSGIDFQGETFLADQDYMDIYAEAFNQKSFQKLGVVVFEGEVRDDKMAKLVLDALSQGGVHARRLKVFQGDDLPSFGVSKLTRRVFVIAE